MDENLAYSMRSSEDGVRASPADPQFLDFRLALNAGCKQVQHLPVEAFPQLPPAVATALRKMGCTIPQSYDGPPESGPQNVIRGRCYRRWQESWAALCSIQGAVRLPAFEDATNGSPETLHGSLEIQRMQGFATGRARFDWLITTAGASQIRRDRQAYGGPLLAGLGQDGIESHIPGKAFVILFRYQAKWLRLQGAD